MLEKFSNVMKILPVGAEFIPCGRTEMQKNGRTVSKIDTHDEVNSRFPIFCESV